MIIGQAKKRIITQYRETVGASLLAMGSSAPRLSSLRVIVKVHREQARSYRRTKKATLRWLFCFR
ncbi:hypothetical protein [Pseudomonas laurylsulfatiphila]